MCLLFGRPILTFGFAKWLRNSRRSDSMTSLAHPPHAIGNQPSLRVASLLFLLSYAPLIAPAHAQTSMAAPATPSSAQAPPALPPSVDSDHDGLRDDLEQALMVQFAPHFFVGQDDCSNLPAEFKPGVATPLVEAENGTIYGQVFPAVDPVSGAPAAEIHYYHLWRVDCGMHGHPLDTEHVAVLVRASGPDLQAATWRALYWYAAAHENTVCDVSQIAHASTLRAQDVGANIWISRGKHASYLSRALCQKGCGADRCENMTALAPTELINLGEVNHPMNGSAFISSSAWPLAGKMTQSNFPAPVLARLNQLPESEIAWFNTGRHPSQGIIAVSSVAEQAIAGGRQDAAAGISLAATDTGASLSSAQESGGSALSKSYRNTIHALATSAHHVGQALGLQKSPEPTPPAPR